MLVVCLLAATIPVIPVHADRGDVTYYDLPPNTSLSRAMVAAPDGSLWLAGFVSGQGLKIVVVSPTGDVTEFFAPPFSGEVPNDMAVGSDGNIWIAEFEWAYLLRVTREHEVTKFQLRAQTLSSIAAGPDGNLWVTGHLPGSGPSVIFRVTVDGQATEFRLPADWGPAGHIIAGPDGRMWFTIGPDRLGTIAMDGTLGEVAITFYHPRWNLAVGADGNVWFAAENGRLVRVTVDGETTEFSLPSQPGYIVAGADGALSAATDYADQLFRITTAGEIEDFPLDHRVGLLAAGPDGSIWFPAFRQGQLQVGRLDSGPIPAVQRVWARH
jgi:virginiamycin B lyase